MNKLKISIERQIVKKSNLNPFSVIIFNYLTGGIFEKQNLKEKEEELERQNTFGEAINVKESQRDIEKRQLDQKLKLLEYEIMNSKCAPESPSDIENYNNLKCNNLFKEHQDLFKKRYPNFIRMEENYGLQSSTPSIGPAQEDYSKEEYIPPRPLEMFTNPSKFLTDEYKDMKKEQVNNIYSKLGITSEDAKMVAGFIPILGDVLHVEDCMKQILLLNSYYEKKIEASEEQISELEDDVVWCLGLIVVPGILETSLRHFINTLRYKPRGSKSSMEAIEDSSRDLRELGENINSKTKQIEVKTKSSIPAKSSKIKSSAKTHAEYFKDNIKKYIDNELVSQEAKTLLKEIDEISSFVLDEGRELTVSSAKKAENILARVISPRGSGFYGGEDLYYDILKVMTAAKDTAKMVRQNRRSINASKELLEKHFCNIVNVLNFKKHIGEANE